MKPLKQDFMMVTEAVRTDEEAMQKKMKLLSKKLFGLFSPVTYKLISSRKVYVPYEYLVFSYEIHRGKNKKVKNSMMDRSGKVGIVFDLNEVHAFHYDLLDNLYLNKASKSELNGQILTDNCSPEEVVNKSRETVQWKVLHRLFRDMGEVELLERKKFYRAAWELKLEANKREFVKFAYLDSYGSENEHVSGLKVRLDM